MRARLPALASLLGVALLLLPVVDAAPSTREVSILVHLDESSAPATRIDGVLPMDEAPTTGGAFNRMQTTLLGRQATGTPWTVILSGALSAENLTATARWMPNGGPAPMETSYQFYIVEDTPAEAAAHRFVVRATLNATLDGFTTQATATLDPAWSRSHLGIVAVAVAADSNNTRFTAGEVVQSAVWLITQSEPTEQSRKAVLIERTTSAQDCPACAPGDEALALLASQYGFPAGSTSAKSYQVGFPVRAWAGLLGGAAVGITLWRWRR